MKTVYKILASAGLCLCLYSTMIFAEGTKTPRDWRESLVEYISQDIACEMGIDDIAVMESVNATAAFSEITAAIVYDSRGTRVSQKITGDSEDRKSLISISIKDALTRVKKESKIITFDSSTAPVPRIVYAAPLLTRKDKKYLGCLIIQFNMTLGPKKEE